MDSQPRERTSSVSEEYMRYLDNPQNVEKRFPVDRRKLEQLIQGDCVWACVSDGVWVCSVTVCKL